MNKYELFLIYLIVINLAGFIVFYEDKLLAKRKSHERISELYLHALEFAGSVFSIIFGIYLIPHKKNNAGYTMVTFAILVIWLALLALLALKW